MRNKNTPLGRYNFLKCLRRFKHGNLENVYRKNANKNNIDVSVLISEQTPEWKKIYKEDKN